MRKRIHEMLKAALERCFERETLTRCPMPNYVVEVPAHSGFGHFATNLPMLLSSSQRRPPRQVAAAILAELQDEGGLFEKKDVAGPGFINFVISKGEWHAFLKGAVAAGRDFGRSETGRGKRLLVEFVSANPTGPLHLGHGRGAAVGDTLCRILAFCGVEVAREFYVNDAGVQIRLLGESIFSRWRQSVNPALPFPDNGYHGEYVLELAAQIAREHNLAEMEPEGAIRLCAEWGKRQMLQEIRSDLEEFRVPFDAWFMESDLHASGLFDRALATLRETGTFYENEGAWWIRTTEHGDDKDRVIRKSDGQYTYFATDIAYHLEKWSRGFSGAINIWGADHHGYIQRVKAALGISGVAEDWLSVLLIQLVKLWKGGQEVRMSKRAGQYVTLKELVEEVGVDAVRFVFLTKSHDSTLDFDVDLVKKQDSENPVYYVQYAHARICSVFRKAEEEGRSLGGGEPPNLSGLVMEEELALVRMLAEFPPLLEDICKTLEPHRLTYYLTELSSLFHKYFNLGTKNPEHRIVSADGDLTQARLFLARGLRTVIENGLGLLGITAPEKM